MKANPQNIRLAIYILHTILVALASLLRIIIMKIRKYYRQDGNVGDMRRNRFWMDYISLVIISSILHMMNAILLDAEYIPPIGSIITLVCVISLEISSMVLNRIYDDVDSFLNTNTMIAVYNDFGSFLKGLLSLTAILVGSFMKMSIVIQ